MDILNILTGDQWFCLYIVICLTIWLILEMTGEMAKARKDVIDGTALECIFIVLWLPILVIGSWIVFIAGIGWLINKASTIRLIK